MHALDTWNVENNHLVTSRSKHEASSTDERWIDHARQQTLPSFTPGSLFWSMGNSAMLSATCQSRSRWIMLPRCAEGYQSRVWPSVVIKTIGDSGTNITGVPLILVGTVASQSDLVSEPPVFLRSAAVGLISELASWGKEEMKRVQLRIAGGPNHSRLNM